MLLQSEQFLQDFFCLAAPPTKYTKRGRKMLYNGISHLHDVQTEIEINLNDTSIATGVYVCNLTY